MDSEKTIDQEIVRHLPHLNILEKQTILTVVKAFVEQKQDWWDEISNEQQEAIDLSLADMRQGKTTPHSEVMKSYKKWQTS